MKNIGCLIALVFFIAACSSTNEQGAYEVIELAHVDEPLSDYWILEKTGAPMFPASAVRNKQAGCVKLSFVITPEGKADNIEVMRSFPGKVFNQAGKQAVTQMRWAPNAGNSTNQAVRSTTSLDFTISDARNLQEAGAACGGDLVSDNESYCPYDRDAMLALNEHAFDQDPERGWRKLSGNPQCRKAAANLIRDYRKINGTEGTTLHWHEGMMRAMTGQNEQAIDLFEQTRRPSEQDVFAWNPYVDATIAFLEDDKDAIMHAREALANAPYPDDAYLPVDAEGNPVELDWPLNLNVVDRLIDCFGESYASAYMHCERQE